MNGGYVLLDFDKIVGTHDFSTGIEQISDGIEITEEQAKELCRTIDYAIKSGKMIQTHFYGYDGCDILVVNSIQNNYEKGNYYFELSYIDVNDEKVKRLELGKSSNKYYIGIIEQ